MRFVEHQRKLRRLNDLIRRKGTGDSLALAGRMEVSRATIFRYLNNLRELGGEIGYCKNRQSFYYEDDLMPDI